MSEGLKVHHKVYHPNGKFPKHIGPTYFVTINGVQVGSIKFSLWEVERAIERLKAGREDWDAAVTADEVMARVEEFLRQDQGRGITANTEG